LGNKEYILIILFGIVLFFQLGSWGVTESSEARYAEIGREMYHSKDVFRPTLLGIYHYHKPPFTYAITAVSYSIFGVNAFAARFFLIIFFMVQLCAVKRLAELLYPNQQSVGLMSMLIYCSIPLSIMGARNLTTDTYLTTFTILSILSWVQHSQKGKTHHFYLFYLFLALGFLTKGPVIFLPTIPFILCYSYSFPNEKKFSIHHILGPLLFIVVGLSWYVAVIIKEPQLLKYFLGTQTIDRVASNKFNRAEPIWYYFIFGTLAMLPWSLVFISKIKDAFKFKKGSNLTLTLGLLLPLLIYTMVSSKLVLYIQPLVVFMAIYLANLLLVISGEKAQLVKKYMLNFSMLILAVLAVFPFVNIDDIQLAKHYSIFPIIAIGLVFLIFRNAQKLERLTAPMITIITISTMILMSTFIFKGNQIKINAYKEVADFIQERNMDKRHLLVYNKILPSLAFHLNRNIISVRDGGFDHNREVQFQTNEDWRKFWLDTDYESDKRLLKVYQQNEASIFFAKTQTKPTPWYNQMKGKYENKKVFGKYVLFY